MRLPLNKLIHGRKSLPSIKDEDGEDDRRYWYLDAKSSSERNAKLIELQNQWEECFRVGKFRYSLISDLRYWSWTPDRKTIELAITDKYRDTSEAAPTYDSELNRICMPKSVPD